MQELILSHASREQMAIRIAACCVRPDLECFYFGCIDGPGHYFQGRPTSTPRHCHELEARLRLLFAGLDGTLCWNSSRSGRERYASRDEAEGRALLTHRDGWTAIAFWDRSLDRRPASNSAFFVPGTLTFAQIVRVARYNWPKVWARFTFPVVQVDEQGEAIQ